MKAVSRMILAAGVALAATGPVHAHDIVAVQDAGPRIIVNEPLPMHHSRTGAGNFNSLVIFLADQLERNIDRKAVNNTFIISTFSDLNKLDKTTPLGRLLGEDLIHEMQVRKWNVVDVRLTRDMVISEAGEFSLSRDIKKVRDSYKIAAYVTGTYAVSDSGVVVNARAIEIDSGLVLSSAQVLLPLSAFTESMLFDADNLRVIKVVGDR